jgi:hypothetical protein
MGFTTLINRIVEIAWKRLEPTPFLKELQKNRAERARTRRQTAKTIQSCETSSPKPTEKENIEKPPEAKPIS